MKSCEQNLQFGVVNSALETNSSDSLYKVTVEVVFYFGTFNSLKRTGLSRGIGSHCKSACLNFASDRVTYESQIREGKKKGLFYCYPNCYMSDLCALYYH